MEAIRKGSFGNRIRLPKRPARMQITVKLAGK
jgi:hypothetical protein